MNTEGGGSQAVLAKDAYVMEAPQSRRRVLGHLGLLHAWTVHAAVLFFQELPRKLWDSLSPMVHLQFTKLVYVKNQWKCLRRRLFGCVFFVGF